VVAATEASAHLEPGPDWTEEQSEKLFFTRLAHEETANPEKVTSTDEFSTVASRLPPFSSESMWRHVWMLYAAGILLFASLSFYAFRVGIHRGMDIAKIVPVQSNTQNHPSLEAQISDAAYERQIAHYQIERRDKTIADLQRQLAQRAADLDVLKVAHDRLEKDLATSDTSRQELAQQHTELEQKLDVARHNEQEVETKLGIRANQSGVAHVRTLGGGSDWLTPENRLASLFVRLHWDGRLHSLSDYSTRFIRANRFPSEED
jgi:hypothetical protein